MAEQRSKAGPSMSIAEKLLMKAKRKGNKFIFPSDIFSPDTPSLLHIANAMREEFPNYAEFESFKFPSSLTEEDVKDIGEMYLFPSGCILRVPSPADRTYNWHPGRLFVYR